MSFFAPRNQPASSRDRSGRVPRTPRRALRGVREREREREPVDTGTAPPGYEPTAVTRWFEPATTSEGSAPHWWDPYAAPTPMRCVRLGLLFDALVVPTPVALAALETLRADLRDGGPGPVADCATGRTYFLVAPGPSPRALASAGRAVRHLSTNAHLWLPSPRPFRDEPVWWLEPPRLCGSAAESPVRLGNATRLAPLLTRTLSTLASHQTP